MKYIKLKLTIPQFTRTLIKSIPVIALLNLLTSCCTIQSQSKIDKAALNKDKRIICDTRKYLGSTIVYSGTYYDFNKFILMPFTCNGEGCFAIMIYPLLLVGGLIDLPLDIVADTVILPHTIPLSMSVICKDQTSEDM